MEGYSGIIYESDTYIGREDLSIPYFINCCGYLRASGIDVSLTRTREDYYLIYLTNGVGYYNLGGRTISVDAGNIILYRPGEKQDYFYKGNENAEIYWIHFTGFEVEKLLSELSFSVGNIFKAGIDSDCINIFENIIHEAQIKKPQFSLLCTGYLLQLLSCFSRKVIFYEKGEGIFKNDNMEQVIKTIHAEFQLERPIDYYSKMCNLSLYQFIRNFKKATNLSPGKYIEKLRIAKAKELLINTDLTINEISGMVGYNDPFYFSKVFKKSTNTTPTAFKTHSSL